MIRTIRMDPSGRLVIPQAVRERYDLADGAYSLELVESEEGIVLRPKPEEVPADVHPSGWIVFRSGEAETIDPAQALSEERERRSRRVRGDG
jgi:bifunctional DNA-binding transcriptional regulator/antitoxin component of YhaV-PrlF toxin-antitoxin module